MANPPIQIAATGILRQPERLAALVAASSTFQAVVGEESEGDALKYVPFIWAGESTVPWPRAVVRHSSTSRSREGSALWVTEGECEVSFEFEVPAGAGAVTDEDQSNWFMNKCGAIINEMEAAIYDDSPYSGETHLALKGWETIEGPFKEPPSEDDPPDPASGRALLPRWWLRIAVRYS